MKRIILSLFALAALIVSCGQRGVVRDNGEPLPAREISGISVRAGSETLYTNGALESGYLAADAVVGGLPLRGGYFVRLNESGRPVSGFLSKKATVAGVSLDDGAGFLLDSDGKLVGIKPVATATYGGIAYSGEWVFFHPNGTVSSGFLANAYTNSANGVVARAGTGCGFYVSGALRYCTLAGKACFGGDCIPAGSEVEFYESGLPRLAQLSQPTRIGGILYQSLPGDPDRSVVVFFETGRVETGFLGENTKVNGIQFKQNTRITFYRSGSLKSGTLAQNTSLFGRLYASGTELIFLEDGRINAAN